MKRRGIAALLAAGLVASLNAMAWTTGDVPQDGVYKFTFGVDSVDEGFAVPASAVCDVNGTYTDTFSYGFLGTTDDSYKNDVPSNLKGVPHAIDGFKVVKGQKIVLHDTNDVNSVSCVCGPAASEYLPAGASSYEGRYPIRFAARMPERGYYAVTCTVANASSTANADVTLFSERCHTHAQHLTLTPGETKTFSWSVELAPNVFKASGTYNDNAINVVVVGENAALASVTVTKQPTTTENATVNGTEQTSINVGKTMWLCDDSTGTDQRCDTPYFALQNYAGVGSGLSRWAPADLSIRNQGEGGLASNDNAHFNSCLLKPGDYLYVEYGHNESSTESFTNNLEKYLTRANDAGAYLIIVSPVERHYSWDSTNNQWNRTLQGYATAGKAWVEAKIANGAANVAFLDLNEYYSTWMNEEIVRINGINSSVSLKDAIGFYYQCSKGGKVDSAHPNNAGADWGAYWVWKAAVDAVAAGVDAEEDTSAKIQATVLAGITDGVAARLAADEPWLVSDDIINAGKAPNSYWDATVRAGYDYINSAAVAAVDATVSEGVATISGVKMRVLNQVNYAKAVIDIVSADKATTNRWYSFYNYDASGNVSGDIVVPEEPGFLSADLDKDVATTSSAEYSETLTVPAGGKAYIWFAEANGNTWQVGGNTPISAIYPFEAWTQVLLDDNCSDVSTWTGLFGGVNTFGVPDGESYISFSMTGYDSGTSKKNGGFAQAFADSATVSGGRIRVSFKTLYTQGTLRFALSSSAGNSTSPMNGGDVVATLDGSAAVCGASANVTLSADDTPVAQSTINSDEWMDVDMIIDLDAGKATASIGGADYKSYSLGTPSKTPWGYFGVTLASEKAHAGAIDDVKILSLSPSPKYLVEAAANNAKYGSVEINGAAGESIEAVEGSDVTLAAVCADDTLYKFVRWKDANGDTVSTKKTLFLENIASAASYTAVFAAYDRNDDRVATWDFSEYAASPVSATGNTSESYAGLTIYLNNGDSVTASGLVWVNSALSSSGSNLSANGKHIEFTPAASGTLTLKFSIDSYEDKRTPTMFIKAAESSSECSTANGDITVYATVVDTEYTLSANLTAGTKYYIWTYSYNWSGAKYYHNYTISSITYTYAPTWRTVTATAGTGGSATVSASEVVSGSSATFTATPVSAAYTFANWTDAKDNVVSTEATYTATITADTALTANFALVAAGGTYSNVFDFAPFAANPVSTPNGAANGETAYGPFTIYTSGSSYGADTITGNGIYWHVPANDCQGSSSWNGYQPCDYVHYMKLVAPFSGTVKIVFSVDKVVSSRQLNMCVTSGDLSNATYYGALKKVQADSANTNYELSYEVTAGTTYWFYGYSSNWSGAKNPTATTISSIIYAYSAETTTLTLAAGENGNVSINGATGAGAYNVQKGEYVKLVAIPDAYYGLSSWTDGDSNTLSTEETFWCYVGDAMTVTANFASEAAIDITRAADFSTFAGDDGITAATEAWSQLVGRLEVHGAAVDTLTDSGIYWAGPAETDENQQNTFGRYIKFECVKTGKLNVTFKGDKRNGNKDNNNPRMYLTPDTSSQGTSCMTKNQTGNVAATSSALNTDYVAEFDVTDGVTYYIWPYSYNKSDCQFWVSSITYTAAKSDYFALTVTDEYGDTSVTNVYYGDSVLLDAPATTETQIFDGWVDGESASLGSGTHVRVNVTAATSATATYRNPDAHSFVWKPSVASGDWNNAANWLYEGLVPAATYPCDVACDVATIGTEATISLASSAATSNAVFNAATTLTGAGGLTAVLVDGTGAITLEDSGFASVSGKAITINNELWIAGTGTNFVNQTQTSAQIYSDLKGTGKLLLHNSNHTYNGAKLHGDNREFAGEVVFSGGSNRRYQKWAGGNATSSNAFWTVETGWPSGIGNDDGDMLGSSGTYWFGGYDGGIWRRNFGSGTYTLEIGALNTASTIDIKSYSGMPNVNKVGTANLTLQSTTIYNLTINGGSVTMPVGIAPQTLTIAADTKIYLAGDAEWTAGTETNLFSYTTLAGTGAGTLAEQVEVTGLASGLAAEISIDDKIVKAAIIAVPYTDDESATIAKNQDGFYTVAITAESAVLTIPSGVTVSEVVVSPNTTTVTGVPDGAAVKVAVSWEGGSAQYEIVSVAQNGAVTLNENAVVTVGEEEIQLKPVPLDATDDEKPLEVSSDSVSVGVKAIPGLVYRLNRGTSPDDVSSTVSSAKATSSRLSLEDNTELPEGASFYRVSVDVK
ncbi:MAG: hypothetical protein II909_03955 [Kiritimatiellae bacterium]|nr:hypothetical protein [Kiritimatiellia bacterium]